MFWLGKLLGAFFGYLLAGPFGALFGLLLGHYFDISRKGHWFFAQQPPRQQTQNVFFQTTFTIMGYIAKADGRVSENEIRVANHIMRNMMLTPHLKQQAQHYFNLGKQANFNLDAILTELHHACSQQPNLLHFFLELQLQAAAADGMISDKKQKILAHLCFRLGLNPQEFIFRSQQQQQYNRNNYRPTQSSVLENAYRTLGVTTQSSDAELKKAYRILISKNHPDKLVSKGLPEEMIKLANQKTQEIKAAYDCICQARGI